MTEATPKLTIGLAVYNGEATLRDAIDSLLGQTYGDFVLVISDNASSDSTESICRESSRSDDRIRYIRLPRNIGAPANFGQLLEGAESPYFMWAGCDDVWHPEFVARNIEALDSRPDYVCSVSRVEFFDDSGAVVKTVGPPDSPHPLHGGTFALQQSPAENLLAFIADPQCNSRFYGVHRTRVIQRCYSANERYLASDWVVMARTLGFGKHFEVPDALLRRSVHGESSDVTRLILESNPSWVSRNWLPMLPMTRHLVFSRLVPIGIAHPRNLLRLARILFDKNRAEYAHHRNQLRERASASKRAAHGALPESQSSSRRR